MAEGWQNPLLLTRGWGLESERCARQSSQIIRVASRSSVVATALPLHHSFNHCTAVFQYSSERLRMKPAFGGSLKVILQRKPAVSPPRFEGVYTPQTLVVLSHLIDTYSYTSMKNTHTETLSEERVSTLCCPLAASNNQLRVLPLCVLHTPEAC